MSGLPIETLLTELVGRRPLDGPQWQQLSEEDWRTLDERAHEHRCRPALHRLRGDQTLVPGAIRKGWAGAFRESSLVALAQRAELVRIARLLVDAGIPMAALKGAWLAWGCYPEPGMRPMRDLDILVPADRSLDAHAALLASGYTACEETALPLDEWAARFKHLPALESPDGLVLEIHTRLWDNDGRMPPHPHGLLDRSVAAAALAGVRVLDPIDAVMHLAVHAAFHRLDGGPLMLVDFATLAEQPERLDLGELWHRADRDDWLRHAALCIAATDHWTAPGTAAALQCPIDIPPDIIDAIPALLAKPLSARESDIALAKLGRSDLALSEKLRRVLARRERHDSLRGYARWVGQEIGGTLKSRATASDRARGETIARLDAWLRA
ncbi:nucleotidyltransferase family protein [Qipengyuania sp. 6B39]|uniref:nucleotidyltransferase domain-containing protein n=1 Tax=Qipengyuania proteolytica TaxID=2867239 RepID=UPI001C894262|nr:nucleotidyltransferase family protein [Qipengyuania proteolytica]